MLVFISRDREREKEEKRTGIVIYDFINLTEYNITQKHQSHDFLRCLYSYHMYSHLYSLQFDNF